VQTEGYQQKLTVFAELGRSTAAPLLGKLLPSAGIFLLAFSEKQN